MYVNIKISDKELWRLVMACEDAINKCKSSLDTLETHFSNVPEVQESARKDLKDTKSLQEKLLRVYGSMCKRKEEIAQ